MESSFEIRHYKVNKIKFCVQLKYLTKLHKFIIS